MTSLENTESLGFWTTCALLLASMVPLIALFCYRKRTQPKQNDTIPPSTAPPQEIHKGLKPHTGNGFSAAAPGSDLRHRLATDATQDGPGDIKEDSSSLSQERAFIAICTPEDKGTTVDPEDTQMTGLCDKSMSDGDGVGGEGTSGLEDNYASPVGGHTTHEGEEIGVSTHEGEEIGVSTHEGEEIGVSTHEGEEIGVAASGALEGADVGALPLGGKGEATMEKFGDGEEDGVDEGLKEEEEKGEEPRQWSFPPVLEEFNLMDSDVDPGELEDTFSDDRLVEVKLHVPQGCGLGISIVGGTGSPTGDLPVVIKRILPQGLAAKDGRLKMGDQLVAINERLLVGVSKTYALNALSNLKGHVRLLVLQDY